MTNLPSLPIGTELVGDYRIERILGAGGFGITYLAREIDVDRLVTIKEYFPTDFASRAKDLGAVPRSSGSGDDYDWGLDRFIDEARTLGKFDHRHIVRLYRYFRSNNTGYMVLHFEEGQSLKSWLRSLGRAPRQKELDRLVDPLLEALSVIHAADFLHRDIAPDNIIVRKDDSPVLIDFGSARGEIAQHTRTISALVKPGYSPYEQYAETGKQQGPWTDIYAFAGTLYHAVTGKRPPDAPSRIIKDELISTKAAAIGAYRPGFLAAIDHGLSLDIDQRPRSIAEWRGELLAPAPASPGWFGRSSKETDDSESQTVLATAAATVPITGNEDAAPPPDAPGKEGQFVDFVDRLKQRNQKRFAKSAEDVADVKNTGEPEPVVGQQPDAVKKSSSRFRLGWGARRKSNALQKTATPDQAKKTDAVDDDGDQAAGKSAEVLPVAVESRTPPRIFKHSRPRPIRSLAGRRWRALAFRLMIGFGLAAGVVAMQDRLPKLEFRSSGTVSSGQEPSSPVTTTPARQRRKITPP
ncbi:MAG: serine/threonine protein kinase, partial [Hyphomicrobiaceae bacterium]